MFKKSSFILHKDSLSILDEMTHEQAGIFIKAIYAYQKTGILPPLEFGLKMAIMPFINQFERDEEKYTNICATRKNAGLIGGKQKQANASKSKQMLANANDNDSDNDSDSDSEKEIYKEKPLTLTNPKNFTITPLEEVPKVLPDNIPHDIWLRWVTYRREERKEPYQMQRQIDYDIKHLSELITAGNCNAQEIIEYSMGKGWKTLVAPQKQQLNQSKYENRNRINFSRDSIYDRYEAACRNLAESGILGKPPEYDGEPPAF